MKKVKIWSLAPLAAVAGTAIAIAIATMTTTYAYAQTDPILERDPISTNASETVQMTIRCDGTVPPNGTMTMSMEDMNDVDFKRTCPAGVAAIITNETAVVTNQPVEIPGAAAAPAPSTPAAAAESGSEEEEE